MRLRTAKELIEEAGFNPALIGKTRCRIANIPVRNPAARIRIQDNIKSFDVILGNEHKTIEIGVAKEGENDISVGAAAVNKARGIISSKPFLAREKAKKDAILKKQAENTPPHS